MDTSLTKMSASTQDLVAARNAFQSVTSGAAVNQDSWMTQWCSTNWGDLLQPAPLSIALLGSILIIASSVDDFSLNSKAPPGAPPFVWKYARHPDSFKACLQQMVGNGYLTFGTAHKNMEVIRANSGAIPDVIKSTVTVIRTGNAEAVAAGLRTGIEDLKLLSQRCRAEAKESEQAFRDMTGLAQEMAGTTEQALAQNKIQLEVLKIEKESEDLSLKEAKDFLEVMKESYSKAEKEFADAVHDFPSGWDLMGMAIAEAFTDVIGAIGNALSSGSSRKAESSSAGVNAYSTSSGSGDTPAPAPVAATTSPNGVASQPNSETLSDPASPLVPIIIAQVTGIKMLLNDGKPNWTQIRSDEGSKGATYIQTFLTMKTKQLDTSKPISKELSAHIEKALAIIGVIADKAKSVSSAEENALADQVAPTDKLLTDLQALATSVNLVLQQPGASGKGLATPTASSSSGSGAGPASSTWEQMKVDQTKAQLEAARDSYRKSADRLVAQQKELTKTIVELTSISLTGATLEQMLPVLRKAVGSFTILRGQFSKLSQFFDSVASLLVDVMGPSVDRWAATLSTAEAQARRGEREKALGGVTISAMTRDIIYRQMMTPLKISMLANKIAIVYLSISHDFIIPAQQNVGGMLQFATSADKAAMIEKLQKAQVELKRSSARASEEIAARVLADQKSFETTINARLDTIVKAVQLVLPAAAAPVPAHMKEITDAHVLDTDTTRKLQTEVNPAFDINSMM
ncbi:hypothetical protein K438DRAFT_1979424 [Mycena galopus ATCC 62051]|nr:hypothetical protein K438DRAFT_1979424 [Mycena galopus ATCC 62051]